MRTPLRLDLEPAVLSVRELTARVKGALETRPDLRDVQVRGEVSNFRDHPSGHLYFTLKDEAASLRCVMFRSRREGTQLAGGLPRNGEEVVAQGYVGVYERDGQYQLYVQRLLRDEAARLGLLYRALEELKARLRAEGLFDPGRKRPLPPLPRRVVIVTSPTAAALRDIVRIAGRRYPGLPLVLVPASVQGERAPGEIARAIRLAGEHLDADVLIVGRGGGSLEELWAFNTEEVARAIAASRIPVVSAVGHETDFTVADLVADLRAPTPSGAAELVVPEKAVLTEQVAVLAGRLRTALRQQVARDRVRLERLRSRPVLSRPLALVDARRQRLDGLAHRLALAGRHQARRGRAALERLQAHLAALDPRAVLARGYALAVDAAGRPLTTAAAAHPGDRVGVLLQDGRLGCRVEAVEIGDTGTSRGKGAAG